MKFLTSQYFFIFFSVIISKSGAFPGTPKFVKGGVPPCARPLTNTKEMPLFSFERKPRVMKVCWIDGRLLGFLLIVFLRETFSIDLSFQTQYTRLNRFLSVSQSVS